MRPINFLIETCDQYLLSSKAYIILKCKINKIDGTDLINTDIGIKSRFNNL